ncbi:hypothetical protein RPALISO_241 [Ruegeria phage RpAliso]|nr:hypothetical protein RPALISO_241 [Ruegeria phage RpAliso]
MPTESLVEPVDVYFNLHKRLWSLRDRKTGLVIRHARVVAFALGAEMIVRPAGQRLVKLTGRKTVHAFIRGRDAEVSTDVRGWLSFGTGLPAATRITYNPQRADHFTRAGNGMRIDRASAVVMVAPQGEPPQVWAVPA